MPLTAPNLDDRTYADIVAEARSLLPRYAPRYTNRSDTDPGMTLIQLFAWMTELTLYRLNQVPERNYVKFLQLLGIQASPARPAHVDLAFALARDDLVSVIVPKGTQCAAGEGSSSVVFETDEALVAIGAKLKAVQAFDGFAYEVETAANLAGGQSYFPFGPGVRVGAALMLGFDSPVAFADDVINLAVQVDPARSARGGRSCDVDLTTLPVASELAWEYWDGKFWQPLDLVKDDTRAFTRSGHVYVEGPGASAVKAKLGRVADVLYWIRVRLASSGYDAAPLLTSVRTNTVAATQASTSRDEILGGSDGTAGQSFQLANTPVISDDPASTVRGADGLKVRVTSLLLEVDEGSGPLAWQQVDDFLASDPDAPHYTLDRTTGTLQFGDGLHGRPPAANPANPTANVVARVYRSGGGVSGNVGPGTITALVTFVDQVGGVTNPGPAHGGSDEETVEEAKARAPRALKSRDRAVTAEDFEYLAQQAPGARVRRAKALPLHHPQFPGVPIPGVVTVIVVPDGDAPRPTPGPATLAAVCACLNSRRLLTTEVHVIPPKYRLVRVEVDLVVRPDADLAEVRRDVTDALSGYFDPLAGGDGSGWPFGGPIFVSEVSRIVFQTPGVARIRDNQLVIFLDDERQPFCRDVAIGADELLYSQGHGVRVAY